MFELTLVDAKVYERYKHLNKFYYLLDKGEWLLALSRRYKKEEWIEFKHWLLVVIFDVAKKEGYSVNIVKNLLKRKYHEN